MSTRENLRRIVWTEVQLSGMRQVEIAAITGISEKHLSQIMRGYVVGSWETIDDILAAVGRRLVLGTVVVPDSNAEPTETTAP